MLGGGPPPSGYGKPPGQPGYDAGGGYGAQGDYGADTEGGGYGPRGGGRGGGRGAGLTHHLCTVSEKSRLIKCVAVTLSKQD